jgi:hypothetical protein
MALFFATTMPAEMLLSYSGADTIEFSDLPQGFLATVTRNGQKLCTLRGES